MINRVLLVLSLILAVSLFMAFTWVEAKQIWHVGRQDLRHKILEFTGVNHTDQPQIVVVRIDDRDSPNYAQRVNYERTVMPGKFVFQLSTNELYTSNKRKVHAADIQKVYIFAGQSDAAIEFHATTLKSRTTLPNHLIAWDFGHHNSKVWPGFERVTPDHPALTGALTSLQRDRHNGINDGLMSDGIKGINTITLPIDAGRYRLHLWMEDMGDWEYTPHFLERTISFNGRLLERSQFTPDSWQAQRYLRQPSYSEKPDVFTDIVMPFYEHRSFTIETESSQNILTLSGDHPTAQYLSGLLIEPLGEESAIQQVTAQQAEWWRRNWPITEDVGIPMPTQELTSEITLVMAQDEQQHLALTHALLADFSIVSVTAKHHEAHISANTPIPLITPRHVSWQLRRQSLQGNLLHFSAQRLSPKPTSNPLGLPGISTLSLNTQPNTPAGIYHFDIVVKAKGERRSIPLQVTVLDMALPKLKTSIGVYLETPYQRSWFPSLVPKRAYQCDLDRLKHLGLNALSPGLPTPSHSKSTQAFLEQLREVHAAGMHHTILAYVPYKRLVAQMGTTNAIMQIQKVDALARQAFPDITLFWSIADEPSNAASPPFTATADALVNITAGHFNAPEDIQWFDSVAAKFVNPSVALRTKDFHTMAKEDSKTYLYNLEQHRHAAGLATWYWQTDGYFQWHARMPSAYPFSPVDAREDDVFFIYPSTELCSATPDIDWTLLAISQGISDQRWLQWLVTTAEQNKDARQLLTSIHTFIEKQQSPLNIDISTLDQWLIEIKQLAYHIDSEALHGSNP